MKRRRQALQVSTFPFLAVLLCAMGSLILLLLVIDRRAKAVSRAKADQAAARAVSAEAKLAAAQKAAWEAEWEQRRRQLHELLAREEEKVAGQIKTVQGKSVATRLEMQAEGTRLHDLRLRLEAEMGQVARTQEELTLRRAGIAKAGEKVEASRQELVRLAGELERLEQTLHDLRTLREREKQTYSLIPYIGRHGDNRRPIYVECTGAGLVFHPDRLVLEGPSLSPMRIRAEVERRIVQMRDIVQATALQTADKNEKSAYLLMLVRPDGIASYYRTQAALVGLKIEFGYEFVEADWILDFSGDDNATLPQPWMTAGNNKSTSPAKAGPPRPVPVGIGRYRGIGGPGPRGNEDLGQETSAVVQDGGQPRNGVVGFGPSRGGIGFGASREGNSGENRISSIPYPPGAGPLAGGGARGGNEGPVLLRPAAQAGKTGVSAMRYGSSTGAPGETGGPGAGGDGGGAPGQGGAKDGAWFAPRTATGSPPGGATLGMAQAAAPRTPGRFGDGMPGSAITGKPAAPPDTASTGAGSHGAGGNSSGPMIGLPEDLATSQAGAAGSADPRASRSGNGSGVLANGSSVPGGNPPATPGAGEQNGNPASGSPSGNQIAGGNSRSSGQGEPGEEPASPYLRAYSPEGKSNRPPPLPLSRLLGNRDWPIIVECQADMVLVRALGLRVPASSLESEDAVSGRLVPAVQKMIADRQARLRLGEPPYRPLIRFLVHPDGLRTYYLAYPRFEALGLPLTRENVQPPPRGPAVMER